MKSRLWLLVAVCAAWFAGLSIRLYSLQVVEHGHYEERARRQQRSELTLTPPRGTIFDARGRELALSIESRSVAADPRRIENPAGVAAELTRVIGGDRAALARSLSRRDRNFVWVARQLPSEQVQAVRDLDIQGLTFPRESKRSYPLGRLAAPLLGFMGVDPTGLAGLELAYDERVAGSAVKRPVLRDARAGRVLYRSFELAQAQPGDDLYLTIDSSIQHVAERELAAAIDEYGASGGSVVMLDPQSGAVLAMASYPGFDPNAYSAAPAGDRKNIPVQNLYEPGSTFKLVTAAAALDAGVVDPLDRFDCGNGEIIFKGKRIRDHKAFDNLSFSEVITYSSNVGAIRLGVSVGEERLYGTIRGFGFGERTGIDLQGEAIGLVHPVEKWNKRDVAYISFGQGISVTPLQMANAFAAIANGGTLYRPYVVAAVGRGGERTEVAGLPEAIGEPLSAATARTLVRMLERVVADEKGTGKRAAIPGYRVAGKTGTAEKPGPGGYMAGKYVASFVGFAPARDPRVLCLVIIDEPRGLRYHGGDAPAGAFSRIVRHALLRLGVPRDGSATDAIGVPPQVADSQLPTPAGVTS